MRSCRGRGIGRHARAVATPIIPHRPPSQGMPRRRARKSSLAAVLYTRPLPRIRASGRYRRSPSPASPNRRPPCACRASSCSLALLAAVARAAGRAGRRADDAQDEHLGRAELALRRRGRHVRARGREAHQRPLQGPELLCGRAGRRARIGRGRPARHARPHAHVDRADPEFRAGSRDPRHPVPVPRLRAGARRARRPDRPGDAAEVPAEGHRRARLGRERLPPHDEQQAPGQRARRPEGPQDADDGEPDPHPGLQAVRHPADADGVHRGLHGAAAGHGRRPGESAVGHHRRPSSTRCRRT